MNTTPKKRLLAQAGAAILPLLLASCEGIMGGVYDTPPSGKEHVTVSGRLFVDASDWTQWHYIDLRAVADSTERNPAYNPSSAFVPFPIPEAGKSDTSSEERPGGNAAGIYTYWYDVYGAGLGNREFRSFQPSAAQPEPASWSFAVHRNNVRTNGAAVAATGCASIDELPSDRGWLESLTYSEDEWSETDVWTVQDRMLSGLIGNQGITINKTLSSWLRIEIPPMPPTFSLNSEVFVMRLPDGSHAALQLKDYQSAAGVKCCLTINYRYPL